VGQNRLPLQLNGIRPRGQPDDIRIGEIHVPIEEQTRANRLLQYLALNWIIEDRRVSRWWKSAVNG